MNPYALKDKSNTEKRRYEETFKIIRKYTTSESKVLVLGSHGDWIVDEIDFNEIYLVDLKFGQLHYKDEETTYYYEMDLNEFIARALYYDKFDVIIMTSVIEHLTQAEVRNCLSKIKKILNLTVFLYWVILMLIQQIDY